jgi:molecular chaperone GrpE
MGKRNEFEHDVPLEPDQTGEFTEQIDCNDCPSGNGTPEDPDGLEKAAPVLEEVVAQLSAAEKKAQENYDRFLRVTADFENYKKRTAREMNELAKYANEKFSKELLLVVDNLERAIESASGRCTADDPLVQGVEMTLKDTLKLLERHQVVPIASLGQPFDPNYHQAMLQMEVEDQPPNTVVKELQRGFMIHDRLLRPSLVAVSKADTKQDKPGNTSSENGSTD